LECEDGWEPARFLIEQRKWGYLLKDLHSEDLHKELTHRGVEYQESDGWRVKLDLLKAHESKRIAEENDLQIPLDAQGKPKMFKILCSDVLFAHQKLLDNV
jgi:hypothetical protein